MSESGIFEVERPNLDIDGTITAVMKSGRHFTYRVRTAKGELDGLRVVELLRGPDNCRDFSGFGFLKEGADGKYVALWKRCRGESWSKHAAVVLGGAEAAEHVDKYLQSSYCVVCGRKLTTPESLKRGMGETCHRKYVASAE